MLKKADIFTRPPAFIFHPPYPSIVAIVSLDALSPHRCRITQRLDVQPKVRLGISLGAVFAVLFEELFRRLGVLSFPIDIERQSSRDRGGSIESFDRSLRDTGNDDQCGSGDKDGG